MAISIVIKPAGQTYALSVTASQHAAVVIGGGAVFEPVNFAAFINRGSTDVCVVTSPYNIAPPTVVFPVDGTPTVPNSFILPAGMIAPLIVAVPSGGFQVAAIGSAAGPSIIYVTPVGNQS